MAKEWRMVPSGGAASISAFGATKNEQSYQTFYDGFGGGWGWRRGWGSGLGETTTTVENTPVGTLNVDIFDTSNKKLIWRGSSSETLSDKIEKNQDKLQRCCGYVQELPTQGPRLTGTADKPFWAESEIRRLVHPLPGAVPGV